MGDGCARCRSGDVGGQEGTTSDTGAILSEVPMTTKSTCSRSCSVTWRDNKQRLAEGDVGRHDAAAVQAVPAIPVAVVVARASVPPLLSQRVLEVR